MANSCAAKQVFFCIFSCPKSSTIFSNVSDICSSSVEWGQLRNFLVFISRWYMNRVTKMVWHHHRIATATFCLVQTSHRSGHSTDQLLTRRLSQPFGPTWLDSESRIITGMSLELIYTCLLVVSSGKKRNIFWMCGGVTQQHKIQSNGSSGVVPPFEHLDKHHFRKKKNGCAKCFHKILLAEFTLVIKYIYKKWEERIYFIRWKYKWEFLAVIVTNILQTLW